MGENQQVSRVVGYKGGEIVEVEGGHIVRSIGRKDRHSKVCTAKGPRDRRVRLSANTAIQFYDVQDRLGYDRPSKAVDWLIKKAKAAIDELAELPAWQPIIQSEPEQEQENPNQNTNPNQDQHVIEEQMLSSSSCFGFQNQNPHLTSSSNFIAPSIDSDSIAETFKSPFSASTIQFQNYPPGLLSRTNSQELRLSLQSWNDSILLHNSDTTSLNQNHHHPHRFSSTTLPLGTEHALFSLSAAAGAASVAGGGGGGFWAWNNANPSAYNPPTPPPSSQLAQNQFFTQRGPLQSSNSPSIRADQHGFTSLISAGFCSGGFSGYQIPARIQGEEEQDGAVNKPCSVSSASRH